MSSESPASLYDAAIVGGSFAGLSAAMYLARARRRVLVVDAGEPRNRFAHASHGFFGHDGKTPATMLAEARRQLLAYPSVRVVHARVSQVAHAADGFLATTEDGVEFRSRKVVLATGITDILPDIPGLRDRWGKSVLHCPYCHGFEVAGKRLGVLALSESALHQARLIPEWGPVTLFTNGIVSLDQETKTMLDKRGVTIESEPVVGLDGALPTLERVRLASGRVVSIDALFIGPPTRMTSPIAEQLGCTLDTGPLGPIVRTDTAKLTTVPGVYAAGDLARQPHNISWAVADGVTAGVSAHQSLVAASLA